MTEEKLDPCTLRLWDELKPKSSPSLAQACIIEKRKHLKSALYLRLKDRKGFERCPGRIYEKLRKQFRNTQWPFMLDKTQKPLFHQLGTKKHFFEKKFGFFPSENVA